MLLRRSFLAVVAAAGCAAVQAQDTDVPFVTTPDGVTLAMLRLAGVGAADRVIDLGSGDGRIPITAARRFGASALGVEIVPELVDRSRRAAAAAGVAQKVEFREGDLFKTDLAPATVITMYLLPEVNLLLRPSLLALAPGTRLVSHDWDMGDWKPDRTEVVDAPDKKIGREKVSRLHLWIVPARVAGEWCAGPVRLVLAQSFQRFEGRLSEGRNGASVAGSIAGTALNGPDVDIDAREGRLRLTRAAGAAAHWQGTTFRRCAAA